MVAWFSNYYSTRSSSPSFPSGGVDDEYTHSSPLKKAKKSVFCGEG